MAFLITKAGLGTMTYEQSRAYPSPTRGVRLNGETGPLETLRAISLVLPHGAAFSFTTAAGLLRLPVPADHRTHVTAPPQVGRGSRKAITWHMADIDVRQVAGLPCTTPHRTWLDCAVLLDLVGLVAMTDVLLRRRWLNRDELLVPAGVRGARNLRRAAELADAGSLSPRESAVRVALHLAGLPAPDLNLDIIVDGAWIARADMAWPLYRVVVEYDGGHHQDPRQRHQDAQTRNALMDLGWQVRVLTDRHFARLETTVEDIAELLIRQGWTPSVTKVGSDPPDPAHLRDSRGF